MENCYTVSSLKEAIQLAGNRDIFVSYFPEFDEEGFVKVIDERFNGEIPYTYVTYTRK